MSSVPVPVHPEDVLPVRSRISWDPIVAGAFVALAAYLLLNLLGTALGLSLSNRLRGDQLATGAVAWAVVVTLSALFLGGWVTTQCTAGETHIEAMLYGVILWGVVFTALMWLTAAGTRLGLEGMMGMESGQNTYPILHPGVAKADLDKAAARAGLTQDQADKLGAALPTITEQIRETADDPHARDVATRTAWWAFAGTLFSMLSAVLGAIAGCGPTPVFMRHMVIQTRRPHMAVR